MCIKLTELPAGDRGETKTKSKNEEQKQKKKTFFGWRYNNDQIKEEQVLDKHSAAVTV